MWHAAGRNMRRGAKRGLHHADETADIVYMQTINSELLPAGRFARFEME